MVFIHAPIHTHHDRARLGPILFNTPRTFDPTNGGLYVQLSPMARQVTSKHCGNGTRNKRVGESIMTTLYMYVTGYEMFIACQILPSGNT